MLNGATTGQKWALGIAASLVVAWIGVVSMAIVQVNSIDGEHETMLKKLSEMTQGLAVVEANRFTSKDGLTLTTSLAAHERIDGHPVMAERVFAIQRQLDRMEEKLDALQP